MDAQEATRLRLVELQNEALKRENEMLTRENAEVRNMYSELKQSLDKAVRMSRQQTAEHELEPANSEASEDTAANTHARESAAISDVVRKGQFVHMLCVRFHMCDKLF